ncbi:protein DA1 [Ideonella sp. 4Y16]|uniref:protein DA1 n=1 Tax=Ideonella alba TaxID=2824118 RepID=UPI001B38E322|nr:protein DA1 [Ideonella alba]MBQ0942256.1 protein DA1 [Ideonella alba]
MVEHAAPPRCRLCGAAVQRPPRAPASPHLQWWCSTCAATPVDHAHQLPWLYRQVQGFLRLHLGLALEQWLQPGELRLMSPAEWPAHNGRQQQGEARTWAHASPPAHGPRLVRAEVCLLQGLPALQAADVLAHEAFHVYCRAQGLRLPHELEEGTANLWGYLLLAVHPGSALADELRLRALRDPNEIYGQGFRAARLAYRQASGFGEYLQLVRAQQPLAA